MKKHEHDTHSYDRCMSELGVLEDALYVIGGKWKLKIIIALREARTIRFNELQRMVAGISARVLSNELKDLELNGFIKRNVYDSTPVIIEYELTDYSDTLEKVLQSLVEWGHMHREKIRKDSRKARKT
ncbi:winged helix-turn-helix transcriptional regulator [Chitinophaga solisilvae]|uniref:Helix-turn-helix transcriptional regulator n=1 Tax=Chitinophaga solisilvae TaxID=1233460 RepID=A0A3S1CZF0_9BACT|nr:helix-turn-helix domain-containing protein [Chitinophaga solisilvae]NSL85601.1 helix-turn-helix transcriptional regulator [Chitinophaga solisilvae]